MPRPETPLILHTTQATTCRRASVLLLLFVPISLAQKAAAPAPSTPSLSMPPRQLAIDVVANESRVIENHEPCLRYRVHTVDQKGDRVRDTVESTGVTVARLLLNNGKPLTAVEDTAEIKRLNDLLDSPSDLAKHSRTDLRDKKLALDLIHLMPDAMIYTYTPGQPQTQSTHPGTQLVLDYQPNPGWTPPNTTAEALTGLRGRVWIDAKSHQLIRMEGDIFKGVNFGWGMLAHIYPGGRLSLDQLSVSSASGASTEDRWTYTHFTERLTVRALMLKTINVDSTIDATGFRPVPACPGPQDTIRLLLATTPPR